MLYEIHCSLWVDLFPLAWQSFSVSQQMTMTHCLVKFMSADMSQLSTHLIWEDLDRDFKQWGSTATLPYCQQAKSRYGDISITNSLQALLEGILRCQPLPRIPSVLLVHLTRSFGCGPQASIYLERLRLEHLEEREKRTLNTCLQSIYVGELQ